MENKIPQKNQHKINALSMRINAVYDHFDDEIVVLKNKVKAMESYIADMKSQLNDLQK